ncbi:Microtubule-associated protein, microtubule dynamics during spindle orientation [Xylographa trunciseda]|nr:Microtubule-associated protein, microtubule dynamics during spindle orientation [Xylographa trunciseda]
MADQEEDFSSLPLPDRFVHKNWKVRKQGYEDAAKAFESTPDESDPVFKPFLQDSGLWKGAVADSNVAAQQEAINALCSFLKYGGRNGCVRTRNSTITPIFEKGLSSTRAATKQSSLEALLLYIELDKADPVIEELLPALSNKQPKIIAATLSTLTSIYHAYGVKIVDPKPVLKALPKIFGHADKNVRAEASNLVVELYRWLREAIKTLFWNDLKPVQQQDLEKLFEVVKQEPHPKQERLLRTQQAAVEAATASGGGGDNEAEGEDDEGEAEVDAFDLAEPVDVVSKIPPDFYENLASTKWKDRKEALDALYAVVKVDRIKDGSFDELISVFAKCMKDANIAVVTVAANCVEALAKGLRKSFAKYRGRIMSPILERLKEKKQSVADALGAALDAVFASTSLSDCLEEILEFLKHKNPQVKLETLRFLIRCLKTTRSAPSKAETKSIADAATKLLTESTEVTRSGGAEILGTLMKIMGERSMNPYLEGLDDIRKTKIKEYFDAAEVKAKDKPKPAAPPPPKAAPAPQKKVLGKKPATGVKKAPPRPATPQEDPPPPPPPTTKPAASRGIPSKLSGVPKSGLAAPSGALKLQKRLAGPAGASVPVLSSPQRNIPTPTFDDEAIPPPKLGLGSRGLAGRPLGKPISAPSESAAPSVAPGMSAIERAELEELRAEKERLQKLSEDLRVDKSRLASQINELQNQNAQLIEDHTRDVLSIKAKETQLVRARSDAEAAEQTVQKQQREMERLKRELSRVTRAATPPMGTDGGDHIYRDAGMGMNGTNHIVSGVDRYESSRASREIGYQRARSYMSSPSEEKENGGLDAQRGKLGSPESRGRDMSDEARSRGGSPGRAQDGRDSVTGQPIESWRRAAEVTNQLKARIEQMKARQALARPH